MRPLRYLEGREIAMNISNLSELDIFLRDKPVGWSRLLAARAALRVLPVVVAPGMPEAYWLPMFRACFMAWAAGRFPQHDMTEAVRLAADSAARSAARSATRSAALLAALSAADSASRSADRTIADSNVRAASRAAARSSVTSATRIGARSPYDARSDAWRALNMDLLWLINNANEKPAEDLIGEPLWQEHLPRWVENRWEKVAYNIKVSKNLYGLWFGWYHSILSHGAVSSNLFYHEDIALRISGQSEEWWSRPAAAVNADIAKWLVEGEVESVVIPEPEPGTLLGVSSDGRLGIVPSGAPTLDEEFAGEVLQEILLEKTEELCLIIAGSNAFAVLSKDVEKYGECLRCQPLSIDRLYARGIALESTRTYLQKDIDAGNLPEMAIEVASGLDSILAIHGPLIAGSNRGRVLLEQSHQYEGKAADISVSRLAAREFANAVARSDRLFTDEVREEWPVMANSIGAGRYPERSTQVAMVGNKNLMIALAILVATPVVESAITASIPGALAVGSLKGTIDAAWLFMTSYLPAITNLVQVSGPSLAWMKPVLRLIGRGRG